MNVENMTNEELIDFFNAENGIYTGEVMKEICRRADMMKEYEKADDNNFVQVVQNACRVLKKYC